jgi:F-type H+-transporting ATPase subunit b
MKDNRKLVWFCFFVFAVAMSLHFLGTDALAAENNGGWRSTYDLIMKWVNFGILVFVLVKFAGGPIKEFLQGRKEEVTVEIRKIEKEKEKASERIKEAIQTLEESDVRFEKLKGRILKQGEREKQKIIENAQDQSRIMLKGAKRKIENRIYQAQKTIRSEMVDAAIELALERLPNEITNQDNQRFIEVFLDTASAK